MNQEQLISLIGQLEVTYRQLSSVSVMLCNVNGVLVESLNLTDAMRVAKCGAIGDEVNKALTIATMAIEKAATATCILYPENN